MVQYCCTKLRIVVYAFEDFLVIAIIIASYTQRTQSSSTAI